MSASDLAVLEHLEAWEKFLPEEILALAVIGLGGEHADRVLGQLVAPEVGLAAPDREQHVPARQVSLDRSDVMRARPPLRPSSASRAMLASLM
jgi:hypothetical protein